MTSIASKITDMHVCPMITPGTPPIPHVGGPVLPPGVPTVLASGMPATPIGNICTCVGPPDTTSLGSKTVLIQNRMWVRLLIDTTAHGGMVVGPGAPTIIVGG